MTTFTSKNIIILGILSFLVMSFWSLYFMPLNNHGQMLNCPFMNSLSNFCQMGVTEHINQWRQYFLAIRSKNSLLFFSALLFFFTVMIFSVNKKEYDKLKFRKFYNYIYQYNPEIKFFDYILVAFSRGIVHPKIYA